MFGITLISRDHLSEKERRRKTATAGTKKIDFECGTKLQKMCLHHFERFGGAAKAGEPCVMGMSQCFPRKPACQTQEVNQKSVGIRCANTQNCISVKEFEC